MMCRNDDGEIAQRQSWAEVIWEIPVYRGARTRMMMPPTLGCSW